MKEDWRETGRSVTENASTPQRRTLFCKCFTIFEKRLERSWHCPDCAFQMFGEDLADKLEDAILKNREMVWQKNPKGAIACGKCEGLEMVEKWQRFGFYMCAGCEDLISGTY
jgi:ssDNA-binding Zn-finger/Zn-ribbon topoisomerase 1